jgi:hypothetical protein
MLAMLVKLYTLRSLHTWKLSTLYAADAYSQLNYLLFIEKFQFLRFSRLCIDPRSTSGRKKITPKFLPICNLSVALLAGNNLLHRASKLQRWQKK